MDASLGELGHGSVSVLGACSPVRRAQACRSPGILGSSLVPEIRLLILAVLVSCWGSDLISQVYPSWFPVMPGSASPVFQPLAGWPRPAGIWGPADPGQRPPPSNPFIRHSGVHGFVDTMGTADPNDDREYFIAC